MIIVLGKKMGAQTSQCNYTPMKRRSKTNNAKTVRIGGAQSMHVKDFTFISIHMVKEFSIAKIEKRNYRPHH